MGRATWKTRPAGTAGLVPRAYLNGTSRRGPTPEGRPGRDGHIRGRSKLFMKYLG